MRHWESAATDDGSLHAMGNGKMCVYGQGPDTFQIFGPPYTTSSFIHLSVKPDQGIQVDSEREPGCAIWTHHLKRNGETIGTIREYVDGQLPCFVREIELSAPCSLILGVDADIVVTDNTNLYAPRSVEKGLLFSTMAGRYVYQCDIRNPPSGYPMPYASYYQFFASGSVQLEPMAMGKQWEVCLAPGKSVLYIIGGPHFPLAVENSEAMLSLAPGESLARTRAYWKKYASSRHDFSSMVPKDAPGRERFLQAIDDVAVLIKAQQGEDGGVLAGSTYHLAYIRDQYGVFRCLLRLGHLKEAKAILQHYWANWQREGRLNNAQGIGLPHIQHPAENEDTEITGYITLYAMDYLRVSGDLDFIREINPMLEWAWKVQKNQLIKDMMPFSGDETYIAMSALPRVVLNGDGSAEATMFFINGGERLLDWAEKNHLWPEAVLAEDRKILTRVRSHYRENFMVDGRYITNNLSRREGVTPPRFRLGVCEKCMKTPAREGWYFGWVERNHNGRYLCPDCITSDYPADMPQTFVIQSVSTMPLYIGSNLLTHDEIALQMNNIIEQYKKTGLLPSRPDSTITVGYDYGMVLYNLAELGHPMAEEIYKKMLSVVDPTGAWVERYESDVPGGCRCRPWESGINVEGAIHYFQQKQKKI